MFPEIEAPAVGRFSEVEPSDKSLTLNTLSVERNTAVATDWPAPLPVPLFFTEKETCPAAPAVSEAGMVAEAMTRSGSWGGAAATVMDCEAVLFVSSSSATAFASSVEMMRKYVRRLPRGDGERQPGIGRQPDGRGNGED